MLHLKNISKTFGTKKILDNVSLEVSPGSIAVLLGQSGVGKSTLLRILSNLEQPDAGTIIFNGKVLDGSHITQDHLVGMVFQQFNLFDHLTVQDNITLALTEVLHYSQDKADAIAHDLLKQYGLLDKKNTYATQLSGGQKQRLAIARALALSPKIICFDEPTSALDPLLTTHVAQTIQKLADKQLTILVATHDVSLLEQLKCTIYLMQDGKIIESASSRDFYSNKQQYPRIARFVAGTIE